MSVSDVRISTGSAQADEILHGGFPANSINIIMGQPGTGKTIFAEQMAFHNAGEKRPIMYMSTLSEPIAKLIKYLQRFAFFDETKIGDSIYYEDLGAELSKSGIKCLVPRLKEAIKAYSPKIIIIDSFKALHDIEESVAEMRRMLFELTGLLTAYDTTVFLLGEYTDENARVLPEFAIVDGIIQFMRSPQSARDERFLRVLKLRGSAYLEGFHGFSITSKGLDIYPRLVTPRVPKDYVTAETRTPSGIGGLDKVIGGGLWKGSSTLVVGATGVGKTTMALQFAIEGARQGVPSLYVNFQENPNQIARSIGYLTGEGHNLRNAGLELLYISPVEVQIDSIMVTLFRIIQEKGIERVAIDSVGDLAMCASDPQRLHDFLYAMVQHFAVKGVTAWLTLEIESKTGVSTGGGSPLERIGHMADNILQLGLTQAPEPQRELKCVKARGSDQSLAYHRFHITKDGIIVL